MKKINLNDHVTVELTDLGKRVYRQHFAQFGPEREPANPLEISLWELANVFGEKLYMGAPDVFRSLNVKYRKVT